MAGAGTVLYRGKRPKRVLVRGCVFVVIANENLLIMHVAY